jgi:hypothetical protein
VVAPEADWHLPVRGNVREAFTPMVYAVANELFAAHLSDVVGRPFFRSDNAAYGPNIDIRETVIVKSVEA